MLISDRAMAQQCGVGCCPLFFSRCPDRVVCCGGGEVGRDTASGSASFGNQSSASSSSRERRVEIIDCKDRGRYSYTCAAAARRKRIRVNCRRIAQQLFQAPNPKDAIVMRQPAGLDGDDEASVVVGLKEWEEKKRGSVTRAAAKLQVLTSGGRFRIGTTRQRPGGLE